MRLQSYGSMAVDWEERVRLDRLREERLARIKALLGESELGALLCFDMGNIRYITATHIGTWARGQAQPLLPAAPGRRADHVGLRLRRPPPPALQPVAAATAARAPASRPCAARCRRTRAAPRTWRARSASSSSSATCSASRSAIDAIEPPVLFALQAEGIEVVDGQQLMQDARVIKTRDEITLLNHACMMVDAAYEELYRALRPGVRENECVALVNRVLYEMGSEFVEGVNAISGERCSPHPHVFTDRALRPGDPAYFDILHSYMGYRTCYYRTFAVASASTALVDAYKRCRYYLDAAIALIRPGATTADVVAGVAQGAGVRLPRRGGGLRAAVRPRRRALDLGEADLQPARVARASRGDPRGHGLRARDLLAGQRRLVGRAHRGAARRHRRRLPRHHALPRRGPRRRRPPVLHGRRRAAARARGRVQPQHRARRRRRRPRARSGPDER